jgi:hypothetical protein
LNVDPVSTSARQLAQVAVFTTLQPVLQPQVTGSAGTRKSTQAEQRSQRVPELPPDLVFLFGSRTNEDGRRGTAAETQIGSTFRF